MSTDDKFSPWARLVVSLQAPECSFLGQEFLGWLLQRGHFIPAVAV